MVAFEGEKKKKKPSEMCVRIGIPIMARSVNNYDLFMSGRKEQMPVRNGECAKIENTPRKNAYNFSVGSGEDNFLFHLTRQFYERRRCPRKV